jgi:hypothetical protein
MCPTDTVSGSLLHLLHSILRGRHLPPGSGRQADIRRGPDPARNTVSRRIFRQPTHSANLKMVSVKAAVFCLLLALSAHGGGSWPLMQEAVSVMGQISRVVCVQCVAAAYAPRSTLGRRFCFRATPAVVGPADAFCSTASGLRILIGYRCV